MKDNAKHELAMTLDSLGGVLATVNSLALTNTLIVLITGARYSQVIPLTRLKGGEICFALVLLVNIIRFYHGNIRVLRQFGANDSRPHPTLATDFAVIFLQTVMFSVASFYIYSHGDFIALFIVLLVLDSAWLYWIRRSEGSGEALGVWIVNNLLAVAAMSLFYSYSQLAHGASWALYAALAVLACNTIYDLVNTKNFYFPSDRASPAGGA
jgi:hypothetical protein